jgi:quercetin dioxygenase-like cupin family protein
VATGSLLCVLWRELSVDRVNEAEKTYRGGDSGVKYLLRGPKIDWGVILLLPGERLGEHYHNEVEETFYFVQGGGKVYVNEVEYHAVCGDVFRMGPQERHDILNDADEPAKMVFIKCPYLPNDKVSL